MLRITQETKVYVHCPANVVTGGAELLHQLVSILNNNNVDAYVVYFGDKNAKIPTDYDCYNIKVAPKVIDFKANIEVIYEGRFDLIRVNKNTQKLLWWLSVDHFYICSIPFLSPIDIFKYNKKLALKALVIQIIAFVSKGDKALFFPLKVSELKNLEAINGYQSEYAQNFLQNNGFKEIMALKDYINPEHIYDTTLKEKKKNIILYNPKKGFEFTSKIIAAAPQFEWIPLKGMSRKELITKLKEAKIYIDFGYHPGKDRLPRECAMNGCCIITGYRGSAGFFEDVMLSSKYKFKDKKEEIPRIISLIEWIFNNYNDAIEDFDVYRKCIRDEKIEFETEVAKIFGYYN